MVDERDLPKPLSPEERRLAEFHRADKANKDEVAERAARIEVEHGEKLRQRVSDRGIDDEDIQKAAVDILARQMAEHKLDLEQVRTRQVEEAIGNARAELEAERAKTSQPQPTPEITNAKPREAEETRRRQLLDNAKALGAKDDVEAASWVAQAETPDRQHGRGGRYDILKGLPPKNNPPSSRGGSPNDPPPRNPTSPTPSLPPSPTKGPLSANEVLQRFGNPALQARYAQQEQRREDQINSASPAPATSAKAALRGNVPPEKQAERDSVREKFTRDYKGDRLTRELGDNDRDRGRNSDHTRGGRGGRGGGGRSRR
jgi:hypothetical protein